MYRNIEVLLSGHNKEYEHKHNIQSLTLKVLNPSLETPY